MKKRHCKNIINTRFHMVVATKHGDTKASLWLYNDVSDTISELIDKYGDIDPCISEDDICQMVYIKILEFCNKIDIPKDIRLLKLRMTNYIYRSIRNDVKHSYSISSIKFESEPSYFITSIVEHDALCEILEELLSTLHNPREEEILKLYFYEGYSVLEISETFNICRTRVYQIINKGLRKLRHPSRCKWLRGYLD